MLGNGLGTGVETEAVLAQAMHDYDVDDYKLKTLCNYYGIPLVGAHRALADCYATGLLLECLAKDRE